MDNSDIIYALVARGTSVLSECLTKDSGNAAQVTSMLLNKISPDDAKMSYESNHWMVHFLVRNRITYLCVAGNKKHPDPVFVFLNTIRDEFERRYGASAQDLNAFAINNEFEMVIRNHISKQNNADEGDHIEVLKNKVQNITKLASSNLDALIVRGEHINVIDSKANRLNEDALEFERGATKLKRHFFWKNLKMLLCLFFVLLVVIYLIISMICGFDFNKCP